MVTQGLADTQEWTVRELGLWPYVDVPPATTNEIGISKVDGLLGAGGGFFFFLKKKEKAFTHETWSYFGDNEVRNVRPAQKEGVLAILYNQTQENHFKSPDTLSIYLFLGHLPNHISG